MLKHAKKSLLMLPALIALILIFRGEVMADVVVLKNGGQLSGIVTTMEGETLTLTTTYSEPIKIKKSKIKKIITDNTVEIHLKGGEILKGRLKASEEGGTLVEPSAGREESAIDLKEVKALNPAPVPGSRWDGNINVGAGFQSGNTDRTNASVGAEATRKSEKDRFSLRFLFNYAEEKDALTTRNTFGALQYDHFFNKAIFGYISVEMLNDKFKDLSLRTVVGPGVGYQIWDNPVRFLMFEAGVSYFSENLKVGKDTSWITGRIAGKVRYRLFDRISFSDYAALYPSIEKTGEYQLRNEASLSSDIAAGWALNLTNILERDSDPPDEVDKNDLQWILGLKYVF